MKKKDTKKDIKSLDTEIQFVKMEQFIDNFDNSMKKETIRDLKKFISVIGPITLATIGYLIFKNPIIMLLGVSLTGVSGIITLTKDFIKEVKKINPSKPKYNSNIVTIKKEKDVDEILSEGIGKEKGEDFYSPRLKAAKERIENHVETEEERKYREAVERQQQKKLHPHLQVLDNKPDYLNKDETMAQIVREIDTYRIAYNLPPLEITNNQWDTFFNITYAFFEKKGIQNDFYESISQVGRFTFAKALLNKRNRINIYDFIQNLYYLENKTIKKKEIALLQRDILSGLPSAEIINISEYKPGKKRK